MSINLNDITPPPTPQRILVVEDESRLLVHLEQVLRSSGFSVFTCSSYDELATLTSTVRTRFDLIVLDRLLHGKDSADLMPELKRFLPTTRIMILSAINTPAEKASLLNLGADDYLQKPFDALELMARIRALTRRNSNKLTFGNMTLDVLNRRLNVDAQELSLTNKEFDLLKTFMETPGKIFNKAYLAEKVWEMSAEVETNAIEATVNKLRRRLHDAGATVKIRNIRNTGYWIEE